MIYGYIRVSSTDQNEDRQRIAIAMKEVPPKNVYMDKQSGKRGVCEVDNLYLKCKVFCIELK